MSRMLTVDTDKPNRAGILGLGDNMKEYQKEIVESIVKGAKDEGFRVFIAERGHYGFITDKEGAKVVSFGTDFETKFSGNYKTNDPRSTGTGWGIDYDSFGDEGFYKSLFDSFPPRWAVGRAKWKFTTLDEYLKSYQSSSKFTEV